jgi:hypothetical protein
VDLDVVDELKENGLMESSGKKAKFFVEYLVTNWTEEKYLEGVEMKETSPKEYS